MPKRYVVFALTILVFVAGIWYFLKQSALRGLSNTPPTPTQSEPLLVPPPEDLTNTKPATALSVNSPALDKSQSGLHRLSAVLFEFSRPQRRFGDLIRYLRDTGQEPLIAQDKNDVTGELMIVRTKSPIPGTRYFHAQYFSDDGQDRFLQHMSFEVPAGPQAMLLAQEAVQTVFAGLGQPNIQSPEMLAWDAGEGYTVWIKRLSENDLNDNPFNAYTKDDVGTVRIAIEATPEGD